MSNPYFVDEIFEGIDFTEKGRLTGDYENCTFNNCLFTGVVLNGSGFEECTFNHCDFSMVKVSNVAFRNASFNDCKLIGIQFDDCNPFLLEFNFERCIMNYSSFYKMKMKGTKFIHCILQEVDFNETDLQEAVFENCDFSGTLFGRTNLEKADLRTSTNIILDPETNKVKGAKFSMLQLAGLLTKYGIKVDQKMV